MESGLTEAVRDSPCRRIDDERQLLLEVGPAGNWRTIPAMPPLTDLHGALNAMIPLLITRNPTDWMAGFAGYRLFRLKIPA